MFGTVQLNSVVKYQQLPKAYICVRVSMYAFVKIRIKRPMLYTIHTHIPSVSVK